MQGVLLLEKSHSISRGPSPWSSGFSRRTAVSTPGPRVSFAQAHQALIRVDADKNPLEVALHYSGPGVADPHFASLSLHPARVFKALSER